MSFPIGTSGFTPAHWSPVSKRDEEWLRGLRACCAESRQPFVASRTDSPCTRKNAHAIEALSAPALENLPFCFRGPPSLDDSSIPSQSEEIVALRPLLFPQVTLLPPCRSSGLHPRCSAAHSTCFPPPSCSGPESLSISFHSRQSPPEQGAQTNLVRGRSEESELVRCFEPTGYYRGLVGFFCSTFPVILVVNTSRCKLCIVLTLRQAKKHFHAFTYSAKNEAGQQ